MVFTYFVLYRNGVIKKAVAEYNKQSTNPCYFYPVRILKAENISGVCCGCSPSKYRIKLTLGLTTIKKSKIKQTFVIFPSCFERDKTLREDIVINYTPEQTNMLGGHYEEKLTLKPSLADSQTGNKRLKSFFS